MDLVYIVKKDEKNDDLRYSLRSMAHFYPENKVWIVGYKPSWLQNVQYIPVEQKGTKWKNSINNIKAACECPDISDDFILMNDDFFALKPLFPIEKVANATLGNLRISVAKHKRLASSWHKAFEQVQNLLKEIGVQEPYYDYEAHLPLMINKKKYLEVMALPEVEKFMKTANVLHKRTLYKNYDKPTTMLMMKADVKLNQFSDDSSQRLKICGWISVYDKQVKNPKFATLNRLLNVNFSKKCKYEVGFVESDNEPIKNIEIDNRSVAVKDYIPKKRNDFINY